MNDNALKWAKHLRAYKKVKTYLHQQHDRFCALGVACDLMVHDPNLNGRFTWDRRQAQHLLIDNEREKVYASIPPSFLAQWMGLPSWVHKFDSRLFEQTCGMASLLKERNSGNYDGLLMRQPCALESPFDYISSLNDRFLSNHLIAPMVCYMVNTTYER